MTVNDDQPTEEVIAVDDHAVMSTYHEVRSTYGVVSKFVHCMWCHCLYILAVKTETVPGSVILASIPLVCHAVADLTSCCYLFCRHLYRTVTTCVTS